MDAVSPWTALYSLVATLTKTCTKHRVRVGAYNYSPTIGSLLMNTLIPLKLGMQSREKKGNRPTDW